VRGERPVERVAHEARAGALRDGEGHVPIVRAAGPEGASRMLQRR
jgi:hypothetical protein